MSLSRLARVILTLSGVVLVLSTLWFWVDNGRRRGELREALTIARDTEVPPFQVSGIRRPKNRHGLLIPDDAESPPRELDAYSLSLRIADPYLFDTAAGLLSPERLEDPKPTRLKGRSWERAASVILYRNGTELTQGIMGLRVHGDIEPATRRSFRAEECKNIGRDFRLYNRSRIAPVTFPDELFEGRLKRPPRTLVVRRKQAVRNYFAYRIAELIGADTPAFGLVQFEINGTPLCTALLTEHVSRRQYESTIEADGVFYVYKNKFSGAHEYEQLAEWLRTNPGFESVASRINIERFSAHILAHLYLGNRDWNQGAAARRSGDGKWFWVLWDLDTTFRAADYERSPLWLFTRRPGLRALLFQQLMQFPQYKTFFYRFVVDHVNHTLDGAALSRVFTGHELARKEDIATKDAIEDAVVNRGYELVRDLALNAEPRLKTVRVTVSVPRSVSYSVDGHIKSGVEYNGVYLEGQPITLEGDSSGPAAWVVDGLRKDSRDLEITLTHDTKIQALPAGQ